MICFFQQFVGCMVSLGNFSFKRLHEPLPGQQEFEARTVTESGRAVMVRVQVESEFVTTADGYDIESFTLTAQDSDGEVCARVSLNFARLIFMHMAAIYVHTFPVSGPGRRLFRIALLAAPLFGCRVIAKSATSAFT